MFLIFFHWLQITFRVHQEHLACYPQLCCLLDMRQMSSVESFILKANSWLLLDMTDSCVSLM